MVAADAIKFYETILRRQEDLMFCADDELVKTSMTRVMRTLETEHKVLHELLRQDVITEMGEENASAD